MNAFKKCQKHSDKDAAYTCAACQAPICEECLRERADGALVCTKCLAANAGETPEPLELDPYDLKDQPPPQISVAFAAPIKNRCQQHPEAEAVARCANCTNLVCATCDFSFPGDIHLCPACATNPKQSLPSKRKALALWSIGLGIFCVIATIVMFILLVASGGHVAIDTLQVLGCFILVLLMANVIGFALGTSAFNRKSHNPGYLWIGPILNGILGAFWLFRIIAGNLRK